MERVFWDGVRDIVAAEGIAPVEFFTRVRALRQGPFVAAVRLVVMRFLQGGPEARTPGGPRADPSAAARRALSAASRAREAARRPRLRLVE